MAALDAIKEQFPGFAFLVDDPQVGPLLKEAIDKGMTDTQFMSRLRETTFWKRTSDAEREFLKLKNLDPASSKSNINAHAQSIKQMAAQIGLVIPGGRLFKFAEFTLRKGLSQPEIQELIVQKFRGLPLGTRQDLREVTAQYMVGVPSKDFDWWNRQVAAGTRSVDQYEEMLRSHAKGKFPVLKNLIDQGILPAQYFAPFRQVVAEEMGMGVDQVDLLRDTRWKPMIQRAGRGKMTLDDAVEYVRSRPEWRRTDGARAQAAELTKNLLQVFGRRA